MPTLPPAQLLALTGMGIVGVFGLWKLRIEPWIQQRARSSSDAA